MDTIGISKLDLKRQNRMQILRLIRNDGPVSRIDIAHAIHITKAAVTIITNEMIKEGILQEVGEQAPEEGKILRGRKKILIGINPNWRLLLGISLQGGWLDVGVCTLSGGIVEHHAVLLEEHSGLDDLLQLIANAYADLAYKNDLKPDTLLAAGVCIDAPFYGLCGITEQNGKINAGDFAEKLRKIVEVPVAFGSLTEGVSTAEISFRTENKPSAANQVVLQMGGSFGTAVMIGQEFYRGASGAACCIGKMRLGDGLNRAPASERLSRRAVSDQIRAIRTQKLCTALDAISMDNPQRAEWLFCHGGFTPEDPAVRQYFERIREDYTAILTNVVTFFDPQQVILFPDGSVMEALIQAMASVNSQFSGNGEEIIRLSRFGETNLFLTGAALAEEAFFIQRGGYL